MNEENYGKRNPFMDDPAPGFETRPKINVELLRESLRIMHWEPTAIDFIVAAVEGKKS